MKKLLAALVLGLTVMAAPAHADGCGWGCGLSTCGQSGHSWSFGYCLKWNISLKTCFNCAPGCNGCAPCTPGCGSNCCVAGGGGGGGYSMPGPCSSYWPLEAHFQVPAPTGYPYWPAPMDSSVIPQQPQAFNHAPSGPALYPPPRTQAPAP